MTVLIRLLVIPLQRRFLAGIGLVLAAIVLTEGAARLSPNVGGELQALKFLLVIASVVAGAMLGRAAGIVGGAMGAVYSAYFFPTFVSPDEPAEASILGLGVGLFLLVLGGAVGVASTRMRGFLVKAAEDREARARAEERAFGIGRLFERVGEAVVLSDAEGRIILWNPAAERTFGYTHAEAMGMDVAVLIPEAYRERHREGMRRFAQTGHGTYIDAHEVLRLPALRKDGSQIMVDLTLSAIENAPRPGLYALAIMRDVTEQVALTHQLEESHEELAQSNQELREANETLEAFTYVVSHDLKEPVRAIEAFSRALEEDHAHELPTDALDLARRNRETSQRLSRLLAGLLDYSRASRIHPTELEALRVEDVLSQGDCMARFQHAIEERNARLVVTPGPAVRASVGAICMALGNLILNSVRHNTGPNALVKVASRTWPEDPRLVEITVEDNGPGFPDAVRERFSRTKRGRPQTIRGGFGLVIAREAVEKMGGRLWLGSNSDGGGKVHILLPGAAPLDDAAAHDADVQDQRDRPGTNT